MNERMYPVGSYYLAGSRKRDIAQVLGFGQWELQDVRTIEGKYLYKRVA